jgi:RNAse (barnase) inhibitor barstar
MVKIVRINADLITDWDSFQDIFSMTFGFFKGYGRNMDAWIDCMTHIDDKDAGMTKIWINKADTLVIDLTNSEKLKRHCFEIYLALIECIGSVNTRKIKGDKEATISLSLD